MSPFLWGSESCDGYLSDSKGISEVILTLLCESLGYPETLGLGVSEDVKVLLSLTSI